MAQACSVWCRRRDRDSSGVRSRRFRRQPDSGNQGQGRGDRPAGRGKRGPRVGDSTMRFMTIYKPGEESTTPPTKEHMEAMGKFIQELAASGTLIQTDGLVHSSKGARVTLKADGTFKSVDGPFTEAKEIIGGYAIINAKSKAEAIELTKRFLKVAGGGESEVREMHEQPAYDARSRQLGGATRADAAEATR